MEECWAKALKNCSSELTKEHYVSNKIFGDYGVLIKGFPWCRNKFMPIGTSSLTRKMLCMKHNSTTSQLDVEGTRLFSNCNEFYRLGKIRDEGLLIDPPQVTLDSNGEMLERWFLKILVNFSYGSDFYIGKNSKEKGFPSKNIVDIIFGKRSVSYPNGLYIFGEMNRNYFSNEFIHVLPYIKGDEILGSVFKIRGLEFGVFFANERIDSFANSIKYSDGIFNLKGPIYHPKMIKYEIRNRFSHGLKFKW